MASQVRVYLIRNVSTGQWYGERPADWYNSFTNAKMFTEQSEAIRYSKTRQICKGVSEVITILVGFPDMAEATGVTPEPQPVQNAAPADTGPTAAPKPARKRKAA